MSLHASLAIGTLLAALCWFRGGVDPSLSAAAFGLVLAACAALLLCGARFGLEVRLPWPVAAIALLPLVQLIPLGAARPLFWPSWREDLTRRFAELGVESASSISIYPYATLQSALVLAGCCGLFVLAWAVAQSRRDATVVLAAAVLTLAAAEAIFGLWQVFGEGLLTVGATAGAAPQAHGTFANRNHFAVLLAAGFCLALGLIARSARGDRYVPAGKPRQSLANWAYGAAAAVCVAGVVASGSRMGILVAGAAVVMGPRIFFRDSKRLFLPVALAALLFVIVLSFPQDAGGFAKLLADKGDPGRIAIWSDALATAARHFPTGSGLGTFAFAFRRSEPYFPRNTIDHAHCDVLEFLVELGLAGTLFLAAAIAFAFRYALRRPKRNTPTNSAELRTGCLLAAAAILLHSTVDFPLQIPALAALFSVLLGSAVGLACDADSSRRPRPIRRLTCALACGLFAVIAAAAASGLPPSWNAASLHQNGVRRLLAGEPREAGILFQQSLAANPYSAPVWLKNAEAAQVRGGQNKASELVGLAAQLEPFTFRTEWPAAQAALRQKHWEDACTRLRGLAQTVPDIQPAIFRAALEAGMSTARIVQNVVPRDAAGAWLRLLADREAWAELEHTLACWNDSPVTAPPGDLRYVFDRLFQRRQQGLMKRLWRLVRPEGPGIPFDLQSSPPQSLRAGGSNRGNSPLPRPRPAGFSAQSLREIEDDPFTFGFGFQWVSHPRHGVRIDFHRMPDGARSIELEAHAPASGEALHLSHYFAATPVTRYLLQAQTWSENSSGGEFRLEVWSANGLAGASPPVRGSRRRRQVEVRFRTGPYDEVLQLRVGSKSAALRELRGRFFVGDFELRADQANTAAAAKDVGSAGG